MILTASAMIRPDIAKEPLAMEIDLKPALTEEQLDKRVLKDFEEAKNKQFKNSIGKLFPAKMIPVMIELSGSIRIKSKRDHKRGATEICAAHQGFSVNVKWTA